MQASLPRAQAPTGLAFKNKREKAPSWVGSEVKVDRVDWLQEKPASSYDQTVLYEILQELVRH